MDQRPGSALGALAAMVGRRIPVTIHSHVGASDQTVQWHLDMVRPNVLAEPARDLGRDLVDRHARAPRADDRDRELDNGEVGHRPIIKWQTCPACAHYGPLV